MNDSKNINAQLPQFYELYKQLTNKATIRIVVWNKPEWTFTVDDNYFGAND